MGTHHRGDVPGVALNAGVQEGVQLAQLAALAPLAVEVHRQLAGQLRSLWPGHALVQCGLVSSQSDTVFQRVVEVAQQVQHRMCGIAGCPLAFLLHALDVFFHVGSTLIGADHQVPVASAPTVLLELHPQVRPWRALSVTPNVAGNANHRRGRVGQHPSLLAVQWRAGQVHQRALNVAHSVDHAERWVVLGHHCGHKPGHRGHGVGGIHPHALVKVLVLQALGHAHRTLVLGVEQNHPVLTVDLHHNGVVQLLVHRIGSVDHQARPVVHRANRGCCVHAHDAVHGVNAHALQLGHDVSGAHFWLHRGPERFVRVAQRHAVQAHAHPVLFCPCDRGLALHQHMGQHVGHFLGAACRTLGS